MLVLLVIIASFVTLSIVPAYIYYVQESYIYETGIIPVIFLLIKNRKGKRK